MFDIGLREMAQEESCQTPLVLTPALLGKSVRATAGWRSRHGLLPSQAA
jgi:hypothetical protein